MLDSLHPKLTVMKMPRRALWQADVGRASCYHLDQTALTKLTAWATGQTLAPQDRRVFAKLGWLTAKSSVGQALSWQKLRQEWQIKHLTPLYLTCDVWIGHGFSHRFKKDICLKISRSKKNVSPCVAQRLPKFCCTPLVCRRYGSWRVEILPYHKGLRLDVWRHNLTVISDKRWVALAIQLIKTLAALHDRGIVHGDFHPGNLLLVKGRLVVLDFEFARLAQSRGQKPNLLHPSPRFLAPEAKTQPLTFASDIYVLAKTLLFLQRNRMTPIGKRLSKTLRPYLAQNPLERPGLPQLQKDILALRAI